MARDIECRTFDFALAIVTLCRTLDAQPGVGRTLSRQLLRSGISIGAKVEEAQARQSRADFISKNGIALKEARETHYWLRLISAAHRAQAHTLEPLLNEAAELKKILGAIIVSARRTP